ncbi:MAG: DUF6502 family protein [Myxococcota bacterium]
MPTEAESPLAVAIQRVLRPLVRILLRNGIPHRVLADYAKQAYVDVATREFAVPGRKLSVSRVSVLTGLTRKEVSRRWKDEDPTPPAVERYNRAARVIATWVREPAFHDGAGRPASLPFDGKGASFSQLVRRAGGDVPPRAMLDELLRVEAVVRQKDERLRLVTRAYVPRTGEEEKLGILGTDVVELIASIDHNLTHPPEEAFFQRKVYYDNLVGDCLPELRERSADGGQALLEELDRFMSRHDRDANPDAQGEGRYRASLGIYYYEEPVEEED